MFQFMKIVNFFFILCSEFLIAQRDSTLLNNYNFMNNQISPIAGKIIVIRTADNFYAKIEILSYYKDLDPSNPANGRHYTFNYVYQPNRGVKSFD